MFMTLITNGREFVRKPRLSILLSKKVLLSMAAVGTAGAMAGLGTFAAFTSTTSASHTASSGTIIINVGNGSSTANDFSVSSGTLVPGDTVQRAIDLISTSSTGDIGAITLTSTATTSSLLDTPSTTDSLHMQIDNCSSPWSKTGTAPAFVYTCDGPATTSVVLASRAVLASAAALGNLSIVGGPAGTDHLLLTLTLPSGAGNTYQTQSSTILYTFNATQRSNLPR